LRLEQPRQFSKRTQPHETRSAFIAGQLGFPARIPGMLYGLDELVYAIIQDVFLYWITAVRPTHLGHREIDALVSGVRDMNGVFLIAYRQSEQERIKYELQSAKDH
jgi:hypothetical protein